MMKIVRFLHSGYVKHMLSYNIGFLSLREAQKALHHSQLVVYLKLCSSQL